MVVASLGIFDAGTFVTRSPMRARQTTRHLAQYRATLSQVGNDRNHLRGAAIIEGLGQILGATEHLRILVKRLRLPPRFGAMRLQTE